MSETGQIIKAWWRTSLDRDKAQGRALSAKLRRGSKIEVLCERAVHDLARQLNTTDADRLARIVTILAHIRGDTHETLARRSGQEAVSASRFQRLLLSEGDALTTALRRILLLVDYRANIAALGEDLYFWNERTRIRWCFHYFGTNAPDQTGINTVGENDA